MNKRFAAVILAAGESSRIGRNKLALPLGNQSVLEHAISNFLIESVDEIIVVTGKYPHLHTNISPGVRLVHNPDYVQGMGSSVKLGLKSLVLKPDAVFISPADIPLIKRETIEKMINAFTEQSIVIPTYQGKKGHPVLLGKAHIEQCLQEQKEKVLYEVIVKNSDRIVYLPLEDEGILMDIDTMEDYERLVKHINH